MALWLHRSAANRALYGIRGFLYIAQSVCRRPWTQIPKEPHSITINYEPAGWQTELRISGVSLLMVLIMLGVGLWQEGKARRIG